MICTIFLALIYNNTASNPSIYNTLWVFKEALYNNSGSEISLNGYYLSDDASDAGKWMFPDTSIAANGYIIVWADKDEDQEGLHANFKLSKSGEEVVLSDAGMGIIDLIAFGAQQTDISTGRYPNGKGDFIFMTATFAAENVDGITTGIADRPAQQPGSFALEQNYPNPFNTASTIAYMIPEGASATLKIYNMLGREVATVVNHVHSAGTFSVRIERGALRAGMYFYQLRAGSHTITRRMIVTE